MVLFWITVFTVLRVTEYHFNSYSDSNTCLDFYRTKIFISSFYQYSFERTLRDLHWNFPSKGICIEIRLVGFKLGNVTLTLLWVSDINIVVTMVLFREADIIRLKGQSTNTKSLAGKGLKTPKRNFIFKMRNFAIFEGRKMTQDFKPSEFVVKKSSILINHYYCKLGN